MSGPQQAGRGVGVEREYVGDDARTYAIRNARYGHRNWIVWVGKDQERHCAPVTRESVKAAMLATGTQGDSMVLIHANSGCGQWLDWNDAVRLRINLKYYN